MTLECFAISEMERPNLEGKAVEVQDATKGKVTLVLVGLREIAQVVTH